MTTFEDAESTYNRNYDPYADICPECGAEDSFENCEDEKLKCDRCEHELD